MSEITLRLDCDGEDGFRLAVNCQLPTTGITAIYGPSGSGKTTLLNCMAGLQAANRGSLIQFGADVWQSESQFTPPWDRHIGFVFQDARLFPHLNVKQNLEFSVRRRRNPNSISSDDVIDWLQLRDLLNRMPDKLSAGQSQRVAIGRALLCHPRLLLMDEPLANLDHAARDECLFYLRRLRNTLEIPIFYISHNIEELSQIADHLVLLENGRIVSQGSLIDLCSRLDSRMSHEEQAAAIVLGTIRGHDENYGLSEFEIGNETLLINQIESASGQQLRLRIPARDVSIALARSDDSSILNIVPVGISQIEETGGSRVLLRLALGNQFLLARITRKSVDALDLKVGDKVFAQIKSAALLSETFNGTPR